MRNTSGTFLLRVSTETILLFVCWELVLRSGSQAFDKAIALAFGIQAEVEIYYAPRSANALASLNRIRFRDFFGSPRYIVQPA